MAYIDTSALVAYYCPEPLSRKLTREIQRIQDRWISPLVEIELLSALAMKIRTRGLSSTDARVIVDLFRGHLAQRLFNTHEIGATEYVIAADWLALFKTPLRAPDALHLAVAHSLRTPMFTVDRILAHSATLLGVSSILID